MFNEFYGQDMGDAPTNKKINTSFPGVRYREHPTRKHGIKKDQYFFIYYQLAGKRIEEAVGWASKGMTAKKADGKLGALQEAHKKGIGPAFRLRGAAFGIYIGGLNHGSLILGHGALFFGVLWDEVERDVRLRVSSRRFPS